MSFRRLLLSSRLAHPPQAFGGGDQRNTFEGPERQQIVIPRDDGVRSGREGASEHMVIVGIARDSLRQRRGVYYPREREVIGEEFFHRTACPRKPLGELWARENFLEFRDQRCAGMENERSGAGSGEEFARRSTPEQRRHHDVGVSDDSQARRAARRVRP